MNGWEDDANLGVVDIPTAKGIHAGFYYDIEILAEAGADLCAMTRDSNLESAIEDLMDEYRTLSGLASHLPIPLGVTMESHLRL